MLQSSGSGFQPSKCGHIGGAKVNDRTKKDKNEISRNFGLFGKEFPKRRSQASPQPQEKQTQNRLLEYPRPQAEGSEG